MLCFYQRGSRRREGPPPRKFPRPPPPPPSLLGRASFTFRARPPKLVPFSAFMARSASSALVISTKPKPRERPVSRSFNTLTRSTAPYSSNSDRIDSSVAPKSRLPTKMFFKRLLLVGVKRRGGRHCSGGTFQTATSSVPWTARKYTY